MRRAARFYLQPSVFSLQPSIVSLQSAAWRRGEFLKSRVAAATTTFAHSPLRKWPEQAEFLGFCVSIQGMSHQAQQVRVDNRLTLVTVKADDRRLKTEG